MPVFAFYFYKKSSIALLVSALLILALGQFTHLDLNIADYYFNTATQQFPWKDTWFANNFMHQHVKYVIKHIGRLLLAIVLIDLIYPLKMFEQGLRVRLRFIVIAFITISSTVGLFKHYSVLHCPWDIARYGGYAPFIRLLDIVPSGTKAGQCFPAGHATVGLWLAALCVFWLPHKPSKAFVVFMLGLSVGFVLGWVQQMRGAHFLFHTLWSTWIAAFVIVAMLSCTKSLNKPPANL